MGISITQKLCKIIHQGGLWSPRGKRDKMGIIEMVKTIKKVERKSIILIEIGKFIYSYGKDAYIISYIFNYKIKILTENNNTYVCAFPRDKLKKIMATLENKKINYLVLDRKNNYREDEKYDNKNLNRYDEYLEKSVTYVKRKNQIEEINNYLIKEIDNEGIEQTIFKIKQIINERRKI